MKGVIVQVGEPKSIVLYNNGKIAAITTPTACHVGMVVTVKFNDRIKILVIALAAFLLLALGIAIGAGFLRGGTILRPSVPVMPPPPYGPMRGRMNMEGHKTMIQSVTVEEAKNMGDDSRVIVTGNIVESLGDEKYTFRDPTGDVTVEIDRKMWRELSADARDIVELSGEVDNEKGRIVIDAKSVKKK